MIAALISADMRLLVDQHLNAIGEVTDKITRM